MRILITNDDGISAPGLKAAEAIARELAGEDGEIWVVAPAFEQSGVSHCISYIRPMRVEKLSERRYAVEGSPADCVLAALHDIMADCPPDLVLSGVNKGHNVAEDTLYSGTIGGAMEAAMHGLKSIAMSQNYGKDNRDSADLFAPAIQHGAATCRRLLEAATWQNHTYGVFYNINFPNGQPLGTMATRQGHRARATFRVEPQTSPNGRNYLWLAHSAQNSSAAAGSDARESAQGWITVTPLHADLTAESILSGMAELF